MKARVLMYFFFVLFCLSLRINAQTTISTNSSISGNWKRINSPYLIKGNISIPKDSTLTIEPGVEIRFDGKYQIAVYGKIRALGKEGDTIRFYPQDTLNRWRGIRYYGSNKSTDSAIFKYCRFEYAGPKVTNSESCLRLTQGHFRISNCVFTKNQGVFSSNSISADSILSMEIKDCYFYQNRNINTNPSLNSTGLTGVVFLSKGTIRNCIFSENILMNPYYSQDKYAIIGDGSKGVIEIIDYNSPNTLIEVMDCKFIRNQCGLGGAGINFRLTGLSKLKIKGCQFEDNRTGRYGCITSIGSSSSGNDNMKLNIENCSFKNNIAANTAVADGVAAIAIHLFNSYDSLFIRNNVFENNTARSIVSLGNPNCNNQYLIGNIFRGNALWCLSAESRGDIWSFNNIYHNNMSLILIKNAGNTTRYMRSINDAYINNGANLDTVALDQRLLGTYKGIYYRSAPTVDVFGGNGGVFRNCIFKGNQGYDGKIQNFTVNAGKIYELSNCLFDSNIDSSIVWESDFNQPRPTSLVLQESSNLIKDPLFVKPPQTYGPNGLDTTSDFRLLNTCSQLSPAYNSGLNSAYPGLSSIRDFENNDRISCDTVDIGPFELGPQYARVKFLSQHKDSTYCDNDMTLVHKSTCNPNSRYVLQKQNGSVWTDISSSSSSTYMGNSPSQGRYRVIYTQLDCGNSDTGNAFNVTLKQSPKPFLGNDTAIEQKATLVLNPGQFNTYKWQDGSSNSTFTINGNAAGIGKKNYHVSVTAQNGCSGSDTIAVTVTWNSSLQSILDKGWKLYPNPSGGVMNIENPDSEPFSFQVMDWMGNLMFGKETVTEHSVIDLGDLPSGVYFIQIKGNGFTENLRVVKL